MSRPSPTPKSSTPREPEVPLVERAIADERLLEARAEHDRESFSESDLTGYDLSGSSFSECEFDCVTLTNAQLRGSRFIESRFNAPFAPSFLAARTTWREVVIENPRWGSAEMFEADASALFISGGKIDYLNLRISTLTDVIIANCSITDLDLGGCHGTRIALRNCRIETLDLTRSVFVDVDLRSSTFDTIIGLDGLRGVTIDDYQLSLFAPLLAAHLGIIVD